MGGSVRGASRKVKNKRKEIVVQETKAIVFSLSGICFGFNMGWSVRE